MNGAPNTVAAWEVDDPNDPTLSVFDVANAPRQLVYISPPRVERDAISECLAAEGHPTGYYAATTSVVWRNGPAAFEVWTEDGTGLCATRDALFLGDGTRLNRDAVTAVVPFTDTDDVTRGVALRLGAEEHTIAIHFKHLAAYRVDFEDGGGWTWIGWVSFVTHQLAAWLGVPIVPRR